MAWGVAGFLEARLAEDEQMALAAANRRWITQDNIIELTPLEDTDGFMGFPTRADARHAASWDPARVLAEIAVKWAILEDLNYGGPETFDARDIVIRRMASVYADHPDYGPAQEE